MNSFMINKLTNGTAIWWFAMISSILSLFLCVFANLNNQVSILYLMPLTYMVSLWILSDMFRKMGLAFSIIQIIMFLRYVVTPVLWAFTPVYHGVSIGGQDYNLSVKLICYECIVTVIAMFWWQKKYGAKLVAPNFVEIRKPSLISLGVILMFLSIITNPMFFRKLFMTSVITAAESAEITFHDTAASGVQIVFFSVGLFFLMQSVISFIYYSYLTHSAKKFWIALTCLLYLSCTWSYGAGVSRWNMMISVLIGLYSIILLFPKSKNSTYIVGAFAVALVVIGGSVLKLVSFGEANVGVSDATNYYFNAEYFDEYFSGIGPVANGIYVSKRVESSVVRMFVDLFNAFPLALKTFGLQDESVSNQFFREMTGRYDLIMPNITISLLEFGWFFSPLYSVLLAVLALYFDKKRKETTMFNRKVYYIIPTFWCAIFMAVNVNIVNPRIWDPLIGICLFGLEDYFFTSSNSIYISQEE